MKVTLHEPPPPGLDTIVEESMERESHMTMREAYAIALAKHFAGAKRPLVLAKIDEGVRVHTARLLAGDLSARSFKIFFADRGSSRSTEEWSELPRVPITEWDGCGECCFSTSYGKYAAEKHGIYRRSGCAQEMELSVDGPDWFQKRGYCL